MKWKYGQLTNAMRQDGWASWGQGVWVYEHQNGRIVQIGLYNYDEKDGREEWHKWAEANETPPPF